jgi:hypothetical protein
MGGGGRSTDASVAPKRVAGAGGSIADVSADGDVGKTFGAALLAFISSAQVRPKVGGRGSGGKGGGAFRGGGVVGSAGFALGVVFERIAGASG